MSDKVVKRTNDSTMSGQATGQPQHIEKIEPIQETYTAPDGTVHHVMGTKKASLLLCCASPCEKALPA